MAAVLDRDDRAARLQGRAFFYQMAHAVFSGEPDETLIGALRSDDCVGTLRSMAQELPALGALAAYCAGLADDVRAKEALEQSAPEYNRFIMGLGANRESHPWESAYTSSKKLLFQGETLAVRDAYREFGYLPEMYPKVADDHIALECAFMAALAQKTLAAEGEGFSRLVDGQKRFLNEHLLKWVDCYAEQLRQDAPDGLYGLMAQAVAAFAKEDAAYLANPRVE